MTETKRGTERVRHELKLRMADVVSAEHITPLMVRVVVTSPEFKDFKSLAYDDHCKLFFPAIGKEMPIPTVTERGLSWPEDNRPEGRDYTPRKFDADKLELTLDFVVHGDGPATSWAAKARPGDKLGVGGPRGSFVLRGEFDWYLLVGDETALPAIGRRIEELPEGSKVIALVEVADVKERQSFDCRADLDMHWLERDGVSAGMSDQLINALRNLRLPKGDGYAFVAGEASMSKAARTILIEQHKLDPDFVKAAGYWHLGEEDFDDGHAH